ncbi:MAG: cytochrome c biogenesis protein DipZ [Alphaproteobacteria bacterium]|nr:cytochrome c biogenesis protein DipZ [Alphaproteobacteria bacterium]
MSLFTYGLAFLEGLGLILSPCILPILPIVLSLGIEGAKWRPYGIIVGFISSFVALTFLSRSIVVRLGVDIEIIRYVSYSFLFIFSLVLIFDYLSEKFTHWSNLFALVGEKIAQQQEGQTGFSGGIILGVAIGCIWVPCAGPIMAAVIVQTITQQTTFDSFLVLLSFSAGVSIPMLILVLMGRKIIEQISFLKSYTQLIRKILGITVLFGLAFSIWGEDMWLEPSKRNDGKKVPSEFGLIHGLPSPYMAPEIVGIDQWINSSSLRLSQLKGKVVLVDFWTYSCINCIRTLPTLTRWDETYRPHGLIILGIHSPEFGFEKKLGNVQAAVKKYNIKYPVALDNNLRTWLAFQNRYWPAHYLINREGQIVYVHFGEGDEDTTESNIRYLLGLKSMEIGVERKDSIPVSLTPETYLGYERADRFSNPAKIVRDHSFDYPSLKNIALHKWSLEGKWRVGKENITAQEKEAKLKLHFRARKVFLVLGSLTQKPIKARISFKDSAVENYAGEDVQHNEIEVTKDTLYELISLPSLAEGIVEISALDDGLQAYAFTFGE